MFNKCPGAANMRTPTIKIKTCPKCGGEVELFSIDMKVDCSACGQAVYNNIDSCAEHCSCAEQCLGADVYNRLKDKMERKANEGSCQDQEKDNQNR